VNVLDLAFRNLRRRPVRSALTILGVGFAVGSFITLYGLSGSVDDNARQSVDERNAHLALSRRGAAEIFGSTLAESIGAQLANVPGVTAVTGELIVLAATDRGAHVLAVGWPDDSFFWPSVPLREGRLPAPGERKVVVIGPDIAQALNKRLGDTISLMDVDFRIVGVSRYASLINRNAVLTPLADLQELTFRPGLVTFLYARVASPENPAAVERISRAFEARAAVTVATSETMLANDRLVGMTRAIAKAMAWIALFMGVLMVLNTLLMAVLERTREIGILSAIGWSPPLIMGALVVEGMVLSMIGSAVGIALGTIGSQLLGAIPAIGRYIEVTPTTGLIAATAVAAVGLGIVGSLYPAWVATRLDPAAALERA
jgi:putative ABC transport system permease protein